MKERQFKTLRVTNFFIDCFNKVLKKNKIEAPLPQTKPK